MKPKVLSFPTHSHALGDLTFIQEQLDLPFKIRRVYYIHQIPTSAQRGGHAHRSNLEVVVSVAGGFSVHLESSDGDTESFRLDNPRQGLFIPPGYWRTLNEYDAGSVCLVLASEPYDPEEYIRDYGEFRGRGRET